MAAGLHPLSLVNSEKSAKALTSTRLAYVLAGTVAAVACLTSACGDASNRVDGGNIDGKGGDETSSGPNGVDPARDPKGVSGILGCPTAPLPAYGNAAASTLSVPFQRSCASCHGGAGEGSGKYPALPGSLTQAAFIAKVRAGGGAMPAFGQAFISDDQLVADFAALKVPGGKPGGAAAASGPATWSDAKIEELYREGLKVWRKAGSVDGQACTHCHSADAVELAVIGFGDDAILRRGQQHLSAEDALTVRDFVHAQRRRLGIKDVCTTDWRPFQPGGQVLPGSTREEQDAAFLKVLEQRKLLPLCLQGGVWTANVVNQSIDGCLIRVNIGSLHRAREKSRLPIFGSLDR